VAADAAREAGAGGAGGGRGRGMHAPAFGWDKFTDTLPQAALAAPRPSLSPSSSSPVLFLLRLPSPLLLLLLVSSWLYDYLRQLRPSVHPTLHHGISAGI